MNSLIITCLYKGDNRCKNECTFADKLCKKHKQYMCNIDNYININKDLSVKMVRSYLAKLKFKTSYQNKNKIANRLFDKLQQHKYFLYRYDRFMDTVIEKLNTIPLDKHYDSTICDIEKHKQMLFPHIYDQKIDYLTVEI